MVGTYLTYYYPLMTKKSNSLVASLATAAGKRQPLPQQWMTNGEGNVMVSHKAKPATVLIAAHYPPDVRRVLKFLEAETRKNLKQLLGEAINDLAAKYGKPEPYAWED
jgi:hypothetical protein